jgi:hypothetical protein
VVFDEATIKERLVVEGGNSNTVLSQFDGPVTFNREVKINDQVTLTKPENSKSSFTLKVNDEEQSTAKTNGAVIIKGGLGIGKNLNVGGNTKITGLLDVTGATTLSSTLGVTGATTLSSTLGVTGATTLNSALTVTSGGITASNQTVTASTFAGNATTATTAANLTRSVNAGSGLNGGGSLNGQDVTLNVGAGDGITVDGDDIKVNDTVVRTGGNQSIGGTKTFTSDLFCQGDITAFSSDERLKTNIKPLENALEKVLSLDGFTYNFNKIGESLGFDKKVTHVGVFAQQIQAVLPEAVVPAPANNDYLTVKYDKIVPLLIEAVKELSRKVDELQQKLNDK